MPEDILDLPPEVTDHIYKFCSTSALINLACCSKAYHKSLQYKLWSTISIAKDKIERELLPVKILQKMKFTSELKLCNMTSLTPSKSNTTSLIPGGYNHGHHPSLITTINCKSILNHCNAVRLTKLNIKSVASDRMLRAMAVKLKTLRQLNLENCYSLTEIGWEQLTNFRYLKKLVVKSCQISDGGVAELAKLRSLEELHLIECDRITDVSMESVGNILQLKELTVSSNRYITVQGLECISKLLNLVKLDLSFSMIDDYIINCICSTPIRLKELDISLCSGVTDCGIIELSTLASLEQLNIQENVVSKTTLNSFCEFTGMEEMHKHYLCDDITLKKVVKH